MRDMPSKFVEILDFKDAHPRISDSDVRLEDVLADHEAALVSRPVSSTNNSSKVSLDRDRGERGASPTSPSQRWKRLSHILAVTRRPKGWLLLLDRDSTGDYFPKTPYCFGFGSGFGKAVRLLTRSFYDCATLGQTTTTNHDE
ncbi:hypothetical protein BJY01DRAFT_247882 [Aspergillus pseudoustus]|uniref:Uncharacterized protein n=1 Tax=Aspergillus pseudoustus TaxID=1810923 RepID=A0ABR4JYD6_9EURO